MRFTIHARIVIFFLLLDFLIFPFALVISVVNISVGFVCCLDLQFVLSLRDFVRLDFGSQIARIEEPICARLNVVIN